MSEATLEAGKPLVGRYKLPKEVREALHRWDSELLAKLCYKYERLAKKKNAKPWYAEVAKAIDELVVRSLNRHTVMTKMKEKFLPEVEKYAKKMRRIKSGFGVQGKTNFIIRDDLLPMVKGIQRAGKPMITEAQLETIHPAVTELHSQTRKLTKMLDKINEIFAMVYPNSPYVLKEEANIGWVTYFYDIYFKSWWADVADVCADSWSIVAEVQKRLNDGTLKPKR